MTALLPSEIPMNRLTISGLFAPTAPPQCSSNFLLHFDLHSVYRRKGSIANTHAEWVIMVCRSDNGRYTEKRADAGMGIRLLRYFLARQEKKTSFG